MKKYLIITSAAVLAAATSLCAQWTLVDDFEGGNLDAWSFFTNQPDTSHTWEINQDPFDAENNAMVVSPGVNPDKRIVPQISLPITAADGETITFYWRVVSFGPNRNVNHGLSDLPADEDVDFWSDYEVQTYLNDAGIGGRNGSTFEDWGYAYSDNTWYEFWYVVRNGEGVTADLYDVYVRGGEYAEQTLLVSDINFRNGTTDPVAKLAILSYYGAAGGPDGADPMMFDDIYVASGEVLTTPPGDGMMTWAGFEMDSDGNVNTGEFMGWLDVSADPFVFSYNLEGWIYLPEAAVGELGAWTYIFK